MGPEATAGSMRKRAKKNGDTVPSILATRHAARTPNATVALST